MKRKPKFNNQLEKRIRNKSLSGKDLIRSYQKLRERQIREKRNKS